MYTPYPHQNEAVDSIFFYYAKGGTGNPVVAMPTASGKSLVIAEFVKKVLQRWPRQRFILATHVKELIEQNAEKLKTQWPQVPLGIFSAGLGQRDTLFPVIYGGIGSMVNCVEKFGWRDLLLIDEAHLLSPKDDTNYQYFIKELKKINPNMRVIGFTATPYRLGQGMLTDDGIFTDICYDLTSFKAFNKLIEDGYLIAPIPKRPRTEIISAGELSKLKITAGDYNQADAEKAVDKDLVTYAACKEIVGEGFDRQCWLGFASGVKHAEHVSDCLNSMGIDSTFIHSKLSDEECDKRFNDWKAGKYRAIVNYGKLTTGVDHPPIDLIFVLRLTTSTVLWVQIVGRGTRPSPATHKENFLVLDFARNTERLGPINDPVIPRKRKKGELPGVPPVRICPQCGVYNHARNVVCSACGFVFPKLQKLDNTAGTAALLRTEEPVVIMVPVNRVIYHRRQKSHGPEMIQVQYFCGFERYNEYVCLEHGGYAKVKAIAWWKQRMGSKVAPPTTAEAMKYIETLRKPRMLRVWVNKKYPEVLGYEY